MDTIEAPLGRREKRKQEIRSRIEEAAYQLFKSHGLEDTSIEQICERADVARRTFYAHYTNKHALLGELGISRLYDRAGAMTSELMAHHHTTRDRLSAMIDYVERNFSTYEAIDRELIRAGPVAMIGSGEQQRIGTSALESFEGLFRAGQEMGDTTEEFSADMLASMVVGTFNLITSRWAMDEHYPVFAKLEEARRLFERVVLKPGC